MSRAYGISFLYSFDFGNAHADNPTINILSNSTTAAGDFDVSNLTLSSSRFRWRTADVATLQEVVFKAELKSEIDTFAIIGHNFTENAIVRLQANIANDFTAPPIDVQISYNEEIMAYTVALGGEYEYYRITVLDPANPCGFIEIGRIVGGRAFTLTGNEDITDSIGVDYDDQSESMKTEGYFRQSNEDIIVRSLSANFKDLETNDPLVLNYANLRIMFNVVKTTKPFLTIVDRDNPYRLIFWGQLRDIPNDKFTINNRVSLPLKIEEVF